jgi:hypothetical protein
MQYGQNWVPGGMGLPFGVGSTRGTDLEGPLVRGTLTLSIRTTAQPLVPAAITPYFARQVVFQLSLNYSSSLPGPASLYDIILQNESTPTPHYCLFLTSTQY